jgi:proline-specific peptidase
LPGRLIELPSRRISLYVREEGSGCPVLLMHGSPGADHSTLLSLLPLVHDYRLIFYDHRCNGRSAKPELATMEWGNLTADAEALRQHFGIDKWAVIGHSFGGMVALEYAIRYPHSLTQLVLVDSGGDSVCVRRNASIELERRGYSRLVVDTAARFYRGAIAPNEFMKSMMILGKAYYSHPSVWLLLKEAFHGIRIYANATACIYGFSQLLSGWSVMDKLNQIQANTLIVAGRDDFQFPPIHQKELQTGILGSKLELLENAGHNAHIEQAKKIVAIVRTFLENG